MSRKNRRPGRIKRAAWQPLNISEPTPEYLSRLADAMHEQGVENPEGEAPIAIGWNNLYSVVVRRGANGLRHLSIHRHDRRAMRDWRHLQQIKSEILGTEATAVEVFPPDSKIFDTSNEYQLCEVDTDSDYCSEWTKFERLILPGHEFTAGRVRGEHKGRQRVMQPGLSSFGAGS